MPGQALGLTGVTRPEAMLSWSQDVVALQIFADAGVDDVLQELAAYRGERNGPVVLRKLLRSFLMKGKNIGNTPVVRGFAGVQRLIEQEG